MKRNNKKYLTLAFSAMCGMLAVVFVPDLANKLFNLIGYNVNSEKA